MSVELSNILSLVELVIVAFKDLEIFHLNFGQEPVRLLLRRAYGQANVLWCVSTGMVLKHAERKPN